MTTSQQRADELLAAYQQNRHLDRERMADLLDRFFAPMPAERRVTTYHDLPSSDS